MNAECHFTSQPSHGWRDADEVSLVQGESAEVSLVRVYESCSFIHYSDYSTAGLMSHVYQAGGVLLHTY